ncbi:MAG: DNA mismatch repair endonuclease MutL [Nitrospirae bacterium]|nr:DNA mismatch repair endonuclease MutL [Nitrospirota bacterium]MBF0593110.1 DNA mismatch repair endonuclease MutL [Nitrospirota bacterium]
MAIIEILRDDLINQIAAGEVIERPASVVKELVENSLDASSTDIRVDILLGGKRLIRIRDNGCGMDRQDAIRCIQRHATSKIKEASDLFNITTMGFRGEALSSIAAVSRLTISTALNSQSVAAEGTSIEVHGGVLKDVKDKVASGTTIEVRDLFYNTPVRKRFLKGTSTELYHITETITQLALIHPQRRFSLYIEEKESLNLPVSTDIDERIAMLYGNDFLRAMIPFEVSGDGLTIRGFVSKVEGARKSRSHQYIFVNKRCIRDNVIRHAVYQGLKDLLREGTHPVFFLYIDSDPATIDCNVHPSKQEIRFLHKDYIYTQVITAIRGAIKQDNDHKANVVPSPSPSPFPARSPSPSPYPSRSPSTLPSPSASAKAAPVPVEPGPFKYKPREQAPECVVRESVPLPYIAARDYIYIGDVFVAYADRERLVIADHHAAHERVLYERLRDGVGLVTYRLLFPIQLKLPLKEFSLLRVNIEKIREMGIEIEEFGADTFIIRGLPAELKGVDISVVLSDIASSMIDTSAASPTDAVKDVIAKSIACHSAVRGRVVLSSEELNGLFRQLGSTNDPHHCPHGRPTQVHLSHDDLRKMFKRK